MSAVSRSETEKGLAGPGVKPPLAVPRRLLRMRSDAALAERFAAGDEAAFDVIYERHRPVVLAVCMGVLGTPPDAEDATQETFSALAVALRTRPPAELRPWLIRVARNASIDTTRRRRHRLLTLDGEIPEVAARPHGSGKAELAVVLDGIRELPEGQRMALLMRELGGHSYAEIAEFLSTDEEAVKGLIARARVGLRTYREATELSCATARGSIAAEPDGRRYDKTIRRHLRGCASCRGYRDALRDDAKALRAALPIQAGTVATGTLSGGMLTAAKGSLISYGLTQAATTCAASACAVGAIGGMVFVAPVHQLRELLPNVIPVRSAPKHAAAARRHARRAAPPVRHTVVTVSHPESTSYVPAEATRAPAATHGVAAHRHHHRHVTFVSLPALPKHHHHRKAAGGRQATAAQAPPQTTAAPPSAATPDQNSQSGQDQTTVSWSGGQSNAQAPPANNPQANPDQVPAQSPPSGGDSQWAGSSQGNGDSQGYGSSQGNGSSPGNGGNGSDGARWRTPIAAGGAASAGATASTGSAAAASTSTTTSPSTPPPATPPTVSTAQDPAPQANAPGWGHGWGGGSRRGGGWRQGGDQTAPAPPAAPAAPAAPATTTTATAGDWSGGATQGSQGGWGGQSGQGEQGGQGAQNGWGGQDNSSSQSGSSWSWHN